MVKDIILDHSIELAFGAITLVIGFMCKTIHGVYNDQLAARAGTLALLRSEIIKNYEKYMAKKWIPIYAMDNVLELYNAYHALGGNGTMTKLVKELDALPSDEGSVKCE